MSTKKMGYALAIIGALGIFISITIDYVGLGKGGIQAAQILGILVGIVIVVFGLSVAFQVPERQINIGSSFKAGAERLLNLPVSVWFVIGFLIVYVWLFIFPVFLNTDRSMVYFNRFLPNANPIGSDMNYTLDYVKTWVTTHASPYPESHYPPLTYVLLSPLTLFSYPAVYFVSTALTLFSYVILTLLLPTLFTLKKDVSLILLLSVTGLFSYGFLFELERAQYYTMAFLLCMLAIYIFHRHAEFRYLAYLMFSVSVHLKIVPIFFLPMFIKDWRDWKGNIKRMAGLGLLNVALLFVLGYRNFINFVNSLLLRVENPTFLW
ncbi:MAG: glycosyltransferase family 87 protein, partial [Anaerolineales bacterium]